MTIAIVGHQMPCVGDQSQAMSLRLANYICLYDTPAFLTSALSTGAAYRDLRFMAGVRDYRRIDPEVAARVLQSLTGQAWYLDPPWIVTALVGHAVPVEEKEKIARTLAATPRPLAFPPYCVTPNLPKLACHKDDFWPSDGTLPSLSSLVGPRTWLLFHLLQLKERDVAWLTSPPELWEMDPGFKTFSGFISSLEVVNDPGERGVKLIQVFHNLIAHFEVKINCEYFKDFVNCSKDEELRQYFLLAVSENRKEIPYKARKRDLARL